MQEREREKLKKFWMTLTDGLMMFIAAKPRWVQYPCWKITWKWCPCLVSPNARRQILHEKGATSRSRGCWGIEWPLQVAVFGDFSFSFPYQDCSFLMEMTNHEQITPAKFNSSPLKSYLPNRKGSASNHHFSGVNSLFNFGGVFQYRQACW